ncbi:ashwin-like [Argonauta hians]
MAAIMFGSSEIDWNCPNLLSKETLLKLIRSLCIDSPKLDSLDKDELVDIYNRYLLPLPQRKYRSNYRGMLMTRKQIQLAKSTKSPLNEEGASKNSADTQKQSMPRFMSSYTPASTDSSSPAKLPASCINFERKTIRLNSRSGSLSGDSEQSPVCDRLAALPNSGSKDANCAEDKVTEANNNNNSNHCSPEKPLLENSVQELATKRPAENNGHQGNEVPEKKKKIIPRITWP